MPKRRLSRSRSSADKEERGVAASNQPSKEVALGDVIWVSLQGSSWWPAQVFDDKAVSQSNKPRNRSAGEVLVRLYGSYKYIYVDPTKWRAEFENVNFRIWLRPHEVVVTFLIFGQNNGNYKDIFQKALEQELARLSSGGEKVQGSKSQEPTARRTKVMQRLGLIAPPGSPFYRNGHIRPNLSLCS